jgi:hypothetical protein
VTRSPRRSMSLAGRALASASLVALMGVGTAQASPDTLRLAIEDMVFGVGDVVAAPVTGGIATAENMSEVSDNGFLQGAYVLPGWLGLTGLQLGQGTLRIVVGALQVVPGLVLFPFEADVPEGFNVFRQGEALVDYRNPLAENPAWLPYVLPVTPITIDVRLAPISPWAKYVSPDDETMGGGSLETEAPLADNP